MKRPRLRALRDPQRQPLHLGVEELGALSGLGTRDEPVSQKNAHGPPFHVSSVPRGYASRRLGAMAHNPALRDATGKSLWHRRKSDAARRKLVQSMVARTPEDYLIALPQRLPGGALVRADWADRNVAGGHGKSRHL